MAGKRKPGFIRTTIVVVGRGRFPVDMLRYDSCVPARESDASEITRDTRDTRRVTLNRFSPEGKPATIGRWTSFGWAVLLDSAHGDRIDESVLP